MPKICTHTEKFIAAVAAPLSAAAVRRKMEEVMDNVMEKFIRKKGFIYQFIALNAVKTWWRRQRQNKK